MSTHQGTGRPRSESGTIRWATPPYAANATSQAAPYQGRDVQRDLVEQAQRGDHDAFSVLARATIGRLDAAARLILRDPDRAQDAVQETLVRCWRDLPTLRDPDRFDAWLNRLFLNACKDRFDAAEGVQRIGG